MEIPSSDDLQRLSSHPTSPVPASTRHPIVAALVAAISLCAAAVAQVGTPHCTAETNSTGEALSVSARGSVSVSMNHLALSSERLPLNVVGVFLTSRTQGFIPNPAESQGDLCQSGGIGRFVVPGQIATSGPGGQLLLQLDLTALRG